MVVFFNLGFDCLEDVPLVVNESVSVVECMHPDATRALVPFERQGDTIRIKCEAKTLAPLVFFLK